MQLVILTNDQHLASICKDYWQQDENGKYLLKVQEIGAKYGMTTHKVSQCVKQHSYVFSESVFCNSCTEPYHFSSRIKYQERNSYANSKCSNCLKYELKNIFLQKKSSLIQRREIDENYKPDIATIDFKSSIYLLAAILALGNKDLNKINPLNDLPSYTLSPDPAFDRQIIRHLINKHLLLISLETSLSAIELNQDNTATISIEKSIFDLTLESEMLDKLICRLTSKESLEKLKRSQEFIELCKLVQLQECLAFLTVKLEEHQLYFSPGEKTQNTIRKCLESFSVAQTYNFIWRATRDAAAYYMRSNVSKKQAANTVVRSISRSLEQALAYDWDVKAFDRDHNQPRSLLSYVIFNTILGSDDGGFKQPLHELLNRD